MELKGRTRFVLTLICSFGLAFAIVAALIKQNSATRNNLAIAPLVEVPTEVPVTPNGDATKPQEKKESKNDKIIDWRVLRDLNVQTGKRSAELDKIDGTKISIPGFMVPLEDFQTSVTEFLLVPSPQACIHVPPPPPNQMIYIKMKNSAKTKVAYGPIWVEGKLKIMNNDSPYGKVSYYMIGEGTKPFGGGSN